MALNKIHSCRFSLMLFVVTFELTYTSLFVSIYKFQVRDNYLHLTVLSRFGIIGKDKSELTVFSSQ